MQLEITLYPDEAKCQGTATTPDEALFEPNGHRRCEHCRKRLHAFAGRLLCANPYRPGVSR
jgi:hypothetical protein